MEEGHLYFGWGVALLVGTILGRMLNGAFGVLSHYIDESDHELSYLVVEIASPHERDFTHRRLRADMRHAFCEHVDPLIVAQTLLL